MIGAPEQIILAAITAIIGVIFLAGSMEGYLLKIAGWPIRIVLLLSGLTMIVPGLTSDLMGMTLGTLATFWQLWGSRITSLKKGV